MNKKDKGMIIIIIGVLILSFGIFSFFYRISICVWSLDASFESRCFIYLSENPLSHDLTNKTILIWQHTYHECGHHWTDEIIEVVVLEDRVDSCIHNPEQNRTLAIGIKNYTLYTILVSNISTLKYALFNPPYHYGNLTGRQTLYLLEDIQSAYSENLHWITFTHGGKIVNYDIIGIKLAVLSFGNLEVFPKRRLYDYLR